MDPGSGSGMTRKSTPHSSSLPQGEIGRRPPRWTIAFLRALSNVRFPPAADTKISATAPPLSHRLVDGRAEKPRTDKFPLSRLGFAESALSSEGERGAALTIAFLRALAPPGWVRAPDSC